MDEREMKLCLFSLSLACIASGRMYPEFEAAHAVGLMGTEWQLWFWKLLLIINDC